MGFRQSESCRIQPIGMHRIVTDPIESDNPLSTWVTIVKMVVNAIKTIILVQHHHHAFALNATMVIDASLPQQALVYHSMIFLVIVFSQIFHFHDNL